MDITTHQTVEGASRHMTLADLHERTFAHATPTTAKSYPPERRLTAEQLTAYLDRRTYAVIGSARPDGRPHASMSMYPPRRDGRPGDASAS